MIVSSGPARLPFSTLILVSILASLLIACGGSGKGADPTPAPDAPIDATPAATSGNTLVGKPQNRAAIGDVPAALARYETKRADMIELFKSQPWYKDGLNREESLFVERSLTFVSRYDGAFGAAYVSDETIKGKLFRYDRVEVKRGPIEVMIIYEPGQDAEREMTFIKRVIKELETTVGVDYPTNMMTVVNGDFQINDFVESEFIRIARCCVQSSFVLAHELAHTYWSMGPSWFMEGMANIYATMMQEKLSTDPPPGWRVNGNLESYYRQLKTQVDSGRFPNMVLSRRFAKDGLYEVASVFLMDIRKTMGEEAFAAAVREMYLQSDFGRYTLREKRLEDLFLAHAKDTQRDAVMALFNKQVWGDNGERYQRLVEMEGP